MTDERTIHPDPSKEPSEIAARARDGQTGSSAETAAHDGGDAEAPRAASEIERDVIATMKTIFDPEIPVNIYELGLIYAIQVDPDSRFVAVRMTLTSPNCPAAQSLPQEVQVKASAVPGVEGAKVDVVWDPPWDPKMMSDAAKLQLGMDG